MKVWEMENTDIIRFVLTREQWQLLIDALAGATAYGRPENRETAWRALDVLKVAEDDIDASKMVKALTDIAERTEREDSHEEQIVHMMAVKGLDGLNLSTRLT